MARHLYIGNNIAATYTDGVLANKAIDVQKLSASGPTSMVAGDTIADSERFRIVQGNGTTNIVSPWIYGRDVIDWSGKSYAAQVAERAEFTFTGNAGADGTHTFKLINLTNGNEPFEFKSYDITVTSGANPTAQTALLKAAIDADLPHWVNGVVTDHNGSISILGFKKGETKADGSIQEDLVHMDGSFEGDTTTMAVTYSGGNAVTGSRGVGDYHYVSKLEDISRGVNYGFYNRGHLPNTPAETALVGGQYDMYHIAATKDGSSSSQINGVDNIIEINIALDRSTAAITQAFESVLNGYLASANFGPVNL